MDIQLVLLIPTSLKTPVSNPFVSTEIISNE